MRKWQKLLCLALALVACAGSTKANYPDRPVRLIVPFAAGGANDSIARVVSDRLSKILGQSVFVENRPGGGTVVGTNAVATAAPDGYTLLLVSPAHAINPHINKSLPYQAMADFTPISQITRSAYVLVTAPQSAFKTITDFAKAGGSDQISFASSGTGSAPHLAGQLLTKQLGLKSLHVPYTGGGPAMVGIIRGDVDIYFSSVAGARSFIDSKQVRPLAVSSDRRLHALPDVQTVAEAGVDGFAINGWYGIMGPARLPADITQKLNAAIQGALKDREVIMRLEREGEEVAGSTPEQFRALIESDVEKYGTIVATSGLQAR